MIKSFSRLLFLFLIASCNNAKKERDNISGKSVSELLSYRQSLSSPADTGSAEPYLFTDRNGLVYLSWIEKKLGKSWLKFSVLDNDMMWSEPKLISSGDNWFVNWADYPVIAADGYGNLLAHFLEKSEKGKYTYDVKLTSSADLGLTWAPPKILHDDGKKAEHGFVYMIPYEDNYFISWLDGRNTMTEGGGSHAEGHQGQMTIRSAIINKEGNKTSEWELDNRVCDCCQTSAAITANGPIVVYRDRSEDEIRDISIVRMVNTQWSAPKPIFSDNWKIDGCPVNGPRASAVGNNLAVAWFTAPDKNARVNIVFSSDGGITFNTPIRVDEGKALGRVDVEMIDEKSALVSWMEGSAIKVMRVYNDGKKDLQFTIATSSESRASGFPQMTKSGSSVIFAWTDEKEKTIKIARLSF